MAKRGGQIERGLVLVRLGEYLAHKCITKQASAQKYTDEGMLFGTLSTKSF